MGKPDSFVPGTSLRGAPPAAASAVATNRRFFGSLWSDAALVLPERFNTWPILSDLAARAPARLEIGPGLRPRLPVAGTCFLDLSHEALARLAGCGGMVTQGDLSALPFPDGAFDLVCVFDVVEHVTDDVQLFRELRRVTRRDATVVLSVPLDPRRWTPFDDLVGHVRRYEPAALLDLIGGHDLVVERSATFGMEPRSRLLMRLAAWALEHRRERAMRWYNAVFMPLGLRLQRPLAFAPGMIADDVGEVVLVCRRRG
jgi:SAM-dependent methyltransferase